jgi:hypothetical protein
MDPVIIDCYKQMLNAHHCTVDDILEDPDLRNEFLSAVRASLTDGTAHTEREILHGLTNLRKRSRLPTGKRSPKPATQVTT